MQKCQVWLFETSGIVQFVYGSGFVANSLNGGYSWSFNQCQ